MLEPVLFDYQNKGIERIFEAHRNGIRKLLIISPGASGKTIIMGAITKKVHQKQANKLVQDFQNHTGKKVAFFTHREELFNQSREKFLLFGNITEPINRETTTINPNINTLTCMVETFNSRSDSDEFLKYFGNVGLVFIDEAHRTDFNKIMQYFPNSIIDGFTATPVSADKKVPLKEVWDGAIEIAKESELKRLNSENPKVGVVGADTYCLGKIDRNKLKKNGQEFDERTMSLDFSSKEQIDNTVSGYYSHGFGLKGLCFNCNVKHNEKMNDAFLNCGIESRQLHSNSKKWFGATKSSLARHWREDTLLWLKHTPKAVVHNVGILTMGYDEQSLELIMVNHSTLSISKFVQERVRGARPFQYPNGEWKEYYRLLDFGRNAEEFGDGSMDTPWLDYYNNPDVIGKREGVGGMKSCPNCGNLNPINARMCFGLKEDYLTMEYNTCGFEFPFTSKEEDLIPREMIKYFSDGINVSELVLLFKMNGWNIDGIFYKILESVSAMAFKSFGGGAFLLKEQFDFILDIAYRKMKELGKINGKKTWRDAVKKVLIPRLREDGFVVDINEIGEI